MFNTFNVVESGLKASSRSAQTVSNNIANENTEGYVKRTTQLREAAQISNSLTGRGVTSDVTVRNTNDFLFRNLLTEQTSLSYYEELGAMHNELELMFQETDISGMSLEINDFFQRVEDLKSNPENVLYQEAFKTQGNIIVDELKNLYSAIESEEERLEIDLNYDIDQINLKVNDIARINDLIGSTTTTQNDLLDKRELLEKELSEIVDISVTNYAGDYHLKIGGITAVRNDNVREFSLGHDDIAQIDRFATIDSVTNTAVSSLPSSMDTGDTITIEINDTNSVSITYGEQILDSDGNTVDFDNDGNPDTVDASNIVRALSMKINNDEELSSLVTAYNGNFTKDENGNPVANSDNSSDRYLVLKSNTDGIDGAFESKIKFLDFDNVNNTSAIEVFNKDDFQSIEAVSEVYLESYDAKVNISDGAMKAKMDNLSSNSSLNVIQDLKQRLDMFAFTLSDMGQMYIQNDDGNYIYGETAVQESGAQFNSQVELNLFSGYNVKTLSFHETQVDNFDQKDIDYLASFQSKSDILFNTNGQVNPFNNSEKLVNDGTIGSSISKYFQNILTDVSRNKENNIFYTDTQQSVTISLKNTYEKMTKVDQDEEMMNLVKYQAAYEANAKIATILQDLLRTTLDLVG